MTLKVRSGVIVDLDPNVVVVQPSVTVGKPVGQQEASLLLIAHGARISHEMEYSNQIGAYVPLDQIKALARKEAVTHIWLDRDISLDEPPPEPLPTGSPESLLQNEPNEHVEADQWGGSCAWADVLAPFVRIHVNFALHSTPSQDLTQLPVPASPETVLL